MSDVLSIRLGVGSLRDRLVMARACGATPVTLTMDVAAFGDFVDSVEAIGRNGRAVLAEAAAREEEASVMLRQAEALSVRAIEIAAQGESLARRAGQQLAFLMIVIVILWAVPS